MVWRWSVCGTAEVVWKPRFLWQWPSTHLHFLISCFSFSSWQYPLDSLWGSGLVSLLASQAHRHHGHLTNFWCFWQCGQVPNPAGKWNQHLSKASQQKEALSAPKILGKRVQWRWFSKNTMDQKGKKHASINDSIISEGVQEDYAYRGIPQTVTSKYSTWMHNDVPKGKRRKNTHHAVRLRKKKYSLYKKVFCWSCHTVIYIPGQIPASFKNTLQDQPDSV